MTREQRHTDKHDRRDLVALCLPIDEPINEPVEEPVVESIETTTKIIICHQCGREFTFSAGEQKFYEQRDLAEPRRCPQCRANQRMEQNNDGHRNDGQSYAIRCAHCGKETTVPFKPQQERPVYCRDCYSRSKKDSRM